jgi:hypothetical protein
MLMRQNFVKIGRCGMVIGAYAGIIIDVYFLGGTPQTINQTNSPMKYLGRLLITSAFFMLEYFLTHNIQFNAMSHGDMLEASIFYTIPGALLLMFMYSYLKKLFQYFNLVNINN